MRQIALFAKWPEAGHVKTRLSPALPSALVLQLYRAMLEDTIALVLACDVNERYLYWADAPAETASLPAGFQVRQQSGPDLGARLTAAFAELQRSKGHRTVVIGADCPGLDAERIRAAFRELEGNDAVLGPTSDGGYYLVGLSRSAPELFRDIQWSTRSVLELTLERARSAGLRVAQLDPLDDIDRPEDLVRWIVQLFDSDDSRWPRTVGALRELGLLPTRA